MKMGDGGLRPGVNVQFAATCKEQVIVGMEVVNAGSDRAQLGPMVEQVQERLSRSPDEWRRRMASVEAREIYKQQATSSARPRPNASMPWPATGGG